MQEIHIARRKESVTYQETEGIYDFNKWNPSSWWKKLFKKWVGKILAADLSAMYMPRTVDYSYHKIDSDKVLEQLKIGEDTLLRAHYKAKHILVGVDEMHILRMELDHHLSFTAPYYYNNGYSNELFGMNITVVPWMKGGLVLPKKVL